MTTYDCIVIGAGITGTALSYELRKIGFQVLLLEQDIVFQGATRYSYGGLAYWSGITELTRTLCREGKARYQILSQELAADIQFREVDLLLTVNSDRDPQSLVRDYERFATPPQLLTVTAACEREPLLNPAAISGAFTVRHGHISPENLNQGYCEAFKQLGGVFEITQVTQFLQDKHQIIGVQTQGNSYFGKNIIVCAGGLTRRLLQSAGIPLRIHFTHTEILETPAAEVNLQTIVMSAGMERFQLEAEATQPELEPLWNQPDHEFVPLIIDTSAVQFLNACLRIGQPSRVLSNPDANINPVKSEALIRQAVGEILPALKTLPATWHHCLVAFTSDSLPLVGAIPQVEGLHVFSGFSNPLVFVPPLAKRFAQVLLGQKDEIIEQLSPSRF